MFAHTSSFNIFAANNLSVYEVLTCANSNLNAKRHLVKSIC